MVLVDKRVCGVGKLLWHIDTVILARHFKRRMQTFLNAFANVSVVMDEDDLRAVMLNELSALVAYGIGHDNNGFGAAYRADERKADALIAAGRFDNDGVGLDFTASFAIQNHIVGGPRFDGTADVQSLVFYKYLRIVLSCHPV